MLRVDENNFVRRVRGKFNFFFNSFKTSMPMWEIRLVSIEAKTFDDITRVVLRFPIMNARLEKIKK